MAAALVPLQNITLGSSQTVTFASIPNTFRDLRIVLTVGGTTSTGSGIKFNTDTDYSNNYSRVVMTGNGSSASSFANSGSGNPAANHDAGALRTNGQLIIDIMDYSATDKHKTFLARQDAAGNEATALAGRWASTAAVTTILLTTDSGGALTAGTTIALYGVKA
jgi:hypothetical protein